MRSIFASTLYLAVLLAAMAISTLFFVVFLDHYQNLALIEEEAQDRMNESLFLKEHHSGREKWREDIE